MRDPHVRGPIGCILFPVAAGAPRRRCVLRSLREVYLIGQPLPQPNRLLPPLPNPRLLPRTDTEHRAPDLCPPLRAPSSCSSRTSSWRRILPEAARLPVLVKGGILGAVQTPPKSSSSRRDAVKKQWLVLAENAIRHELILTEDAVCHELLLAENRSTPAAIGTAGGLLAKRFGLPISVDRIGTSASGWTSLCVVSSSQRRQPATVAHVNVPWQWTVRNGDGLSNNRAFLCPRFVTTENEIGKEMLLLLSLSNR
nr:uncharacterized protein LOC127337994 [Lolium perenne]